MKHYISTYDNIISKTFCNELIEKFENNPQCYSVEDKSSQNWAMHFTQINFYKHDIFKQEREKLDTIFREAVNHYVYDNQIEKAQWPSKFRFEQIRMKRYLPGGEDRFDLHVDVTDYNSARRFLVLFFYLNDEFEGGETVFPQLNIMVKPKAGRLIMFPPMWSWPHKANPILSGKPKYIVGTLLHYI
jgi:hypothetical protein